MRKIYGQIHADGSRSGGQPLLPADWAIEESLTRSKSAGGRPGCMWNLQGVKSEHCEGMAWAVTVVELARMIEKYEPELAPVDPDVLAVREILAAFMGEDGATFAKGLRSGEYDRRFDVLATLDAYRRVKSSG